MLVTGRAHEGPPDVWRAREVEGQRALLIASGWTGPERESALARARAHPQLAPQLLRLSRDGLSVWQDPQAEPLAGWITARAGRITPREVGALGLALTCLSQLAPLPLTPARVAIDRGGRPLVWPFPPVDEEAGPPRGGPLRGLEVCLAPVVERTDPGAPRSDELPGLLARLVGGPGAYTELGQVAADCARLLLNLPMAGAAAGPAPGRDVWRALLAAETGGIDLSEVAALVLRRPEQPAPAAVDLAPAPAPPSERPTRRTSYYEGGFLLDPVGPAPVVGPGEREQFAWDQGEPDWAQILQKRDYYFRYLSSDTRDRFPALDPSERVARDEALELVSGEETSGERVLLSDDGSRAYRLLRELGRGGQGVVYEVEVVGNQIFEGFEHPVTRAALKIGRQAETIECERLAYERLRGSGIVKLLDAGTVQGRDRPRRYLVLERLYPHPYQLFRTGTRPVPVDPATAVDTFVNLLDALHGVHFRREGPLVLCDVKPENVMLRMSNREGPPTLGEYLRRLATGTYEPVLMDMGCAQDREALRARGGRLVDLLIGTPLYLPPEAMPQLTGEMQSGIYSDRTDVYALTITFYEYLVGERPYSAGGLWSTSHGGMRFAELIELKERRASPIDEQAVIARTGEDAPAFLEVLRAGTDPDPERRPTALALLEQAKRLFRINQRFVRTVGEYRYDQARGLRFVQGRFPAIDPVQNQYVESRQREAEGQRRAAMDTRRGFEPA